MKKLLLVCLSALLLMTGVFTSCKKDDPKERVKAKTSDYTYTIDIEPYRAAIESDEASYLVLVNKTFTVDANCVPVSTAKLDPSMTLYGKEIELETTVAKAVEALMKEMWAQGWKEIVVTSGYRTYKYQSQLFNTYLGREQEAHPTWTITQCEEEVLTYSARPGTSEHQTGLCIDLINTNNPKLDESFASHACYAWLQENAYKFGFILRFPKDKEKVTGYNYEPWHYRFVGIDAAKQMHDGGLTLEEYVAK